MVKKVINKVKNNKKFHVLYISLFVILGCMTLGYSALSTTLFLRGEATVVMPEYLILISNITPQLTTEGSTAIQNAKPTFENTEGSLSTKLTSTNSSFKYNVSITNYGQTSGVLDHIFYSQSNDNVKFKLGGINAGDIITSGETIRATITLEYWDDVTAPTADAISTLFNLEFKKYTSDYSNACTLSWDGSSTSEPAIRTVYGTNYYQISNANELAWFSNSVNSGNTGINAILTNNICLNSKSFNQIGTSIYSGIFDGQNRTISDYYFSQNKELKDNYTSYAGLFRNNSGNIKNTNLTVSISDTTSYKPPLLGGNHTITEYIGGLVTNNSGLISNSSVSGNINVSNTIIANCSVARPNGYHYIGSIAGQNSGIITGSYNKVNIVSNSILNSNICNYSKYEHLYQGGITGKNSGYISDSYNMGKVEANVSNNHKNTEYYGKIGGIIGDSTAGVIKYSYNAGTILHTTSIGESDSETIINAVSGCAIGSNASTLNNVYFDNSCTFTGNGIAAATSDFKDLNLDVEYFLGNYFRVDNNNINNGYPVLKWQ